MSLYRGFGLIIAAPFDLPELPRADNQEITHPDIEIAIGSVEQRPGHLDDNGRGVWANQDEACYVWQGVGAFLVTGGRRILVEPHPGAPQEALRLAILGPVLALALEQRGLFVFHASAVSIGGGAVAFLGSHGWGKSTMAAMLQGRGYSVVSDDLMVLEPGENRIVPSFPQLKLWPDALGALGHTSAELPLIHPEVDKRALRFHRDFIREKLPLQRLYLLAVDEAIAIEGLPPKQAFEVLMAHWYCNRFGPEFLRALDLRAHFLRVSNLVRAVPVRVLRRPATLREDPGLVQSLEIVILEDLES
jgi:hypothetical protein